MKRASGSLTNIALRMKMLHRPCLLLLLCVALFLPRLSRADDEVSFDYFYDNLKPYGEWVDVADYGLCWHPSDVAEDWAPYTDGYWAYTDAGWTWVSYEDFGGIVYHYGRWVRVDGEGWCWVPDSNWGPAWVSWRNSDEYVGWAPLPPEAHFRPEVGLSVWVDDTYDIGPSYYRFCHVRDFGAPIIREVCLPPVGNVTFIRETVNITNITINTGFGVPFCGGPRYDVISLRVARPIPALKLVRETNITNIYNFNGGGRGGNRHGINGLQRGNTLVMPAPNIRQVAGGSAVFANAKPARVLPANRVDRGWGSVKAPEERQQIRDAFKEQTKGATPETVHARPMKPDDVKVVPVKADLKAPSPVMTNRDRRPDRGGPAADTAAGNTGIVPPGTIPKGGKNGNAAVATEGDKRGPGNERHPINGRGPGAGAGAAAADTATTGPNDTADGQVPRNIPRGDKPVTHVPGATEPDVTRPVPVATPAKVLGAPRGGQGQRKGAAVEGEDRPIPGVPNTTVPKKGAAVNPGGFKPDGDTAGGAERRNRAEELENARQQNAARQQAAAAQAREKENQGAERNAAAAEQQRQRAAAAAEIRERQAAAAAQARERASAAKERAADVPRPQQQYPRPQAQPQPQPQFQRPPAQAQPQIQRPPGQPVPQGATPNQDPRARGKGKDKKDDADR